MRWCLHVLLLVVGFGGGVTAAAADCTCRSKGRDFELGQSTCLQTPNGPRIATCGMVLNNTSWKLTDTPCVVSSAQPHDDAPPRTAAHDHSHHHGHGG